MVLTKHKLGNLIERLYNKNTNGIYGINDVRGVSNLKTMINTKADLTGRDLTKFSVVYPNEFVFNHRTSRNGSRFSITQNYDDVPHIFTEDYVVFRVRQDSECLLDHNWLYLYFNRDEFDRFVITNSWGSSTEFYNWDDICDIDIELPDLQTQQKFVSVYKAMVANQKSYENGLSDLKLTCDAYIEELRRKMPCEKIGSYISEVDDRNDGNKVKLAQGVDVNMQFIDPKRVADDFEKGRVVRHRQFAYNRVMKANGTKLPIALRDGEDCVISGSYNVFRVNDENELIPEYLMMWLSRTETQRYLGFNSWGSTRDVINFIDLGAVEIPIPDIHIQQAIVDIYNCYLKRKDINECLKAQIKDLCPILIRGSIEEALKEA